MPAALSIGDFSRATHLSIKTLRHYHRVGLLEPAAELAVVVRPGSLATVDTAYGALAVHVASHALRVDGPIREYYLVGRQDTADESAWRTEVGRPIFSTGTSHPSCGRDERAEVTGGPA